ncbi:uncharacterized protein [Cicer arietinum]
MANGSETRVTCQDIQLVQNLIERCLQLYMSPKEVMSTLINEAKIEPEFIELVWKRLKEQNVEFFQAYYTRLVLKQQIEQFNTLLDKQKQLMESELTKVASPPTSNGLHYHATSSLPNCNGSRIPAITENRAWYGAVQHHVQSNLSNVFNNGGSSFGSSMLAVVDMFANRHLMSMPYTWNSNMGLQQGINGGMTKSEPEYSSCSSNMFGANGNALQASSTVSNASATMLTNAKSNLHSVNDIVMDLPNISSNGFLGHMSNGNVLEASPTVSETSTTLFSNAECNSHSVNEALLDLPDTPSNGISGQMSRKFSFPDVAALLPQWSDILEGYTGPAFLDFDNNNK